ncbi:MAG: O-antigen ligase family protein, partial [Bacteroidia bacterium]|nr:O-antigen ligase family protein [Bacteroidia bacterium]
IQTHTLNGNIYFNDTVPYTENGHLVFIHINDTELKKEWEKRSTIPFEGRDKKNNELKYTLYRYLASKGLPKDSAGLTRLYQKDIWNIENGVPNYLYAQAGFLEKRLYELMQEYQYFKINQNPNGKTLVLRYMYWKIGLHIWWENFWIGVGTGDVAIAFDKEYEKYPTIEKQFRLRAHNQFITFALTFGIAGIIVLLINLIYPLIHLRQSRHYFLYLLFCVLVILSFLIDDTLETQPGVTFYALFNTLLIKWCLLDSPSNKI